MICAAVIARVLDGNLSAQSVSAALEKNGAFGLTARPSFDVASPRTVASYDRVLCTLDRIDELAPAFDILLSTESSTLQTAAVLGLHRRC